MENNTGNDIQNFKQSNTKSIDSFSQERATKSNTNEIPSISLPKESGTLKGISENYKYIQPIQQQIELIIQ